MFFVFSVKTRFLEDVQSFVNIVRSDSNTFDDSKTVHTSRNTWNIFKKITIFYEHQVKFCSLTPKMLNRVLEHVL